jgi:hypothetical protein
MWIHSSIGVGYCVIIVSRPAQVYAQHPLYFEACNLDPGIRWTEIESDQFPLPSDELESRVKVKVKFTLQQATKAQRGRIGIALLFI